MIRVVLALVALIIALSCLGLLLGDQALPLGDIVSALAGADDAPPATAMIIRDIRLPRLLLALLVGAALAVAGLLAQTVMRNPLAEPGLLGIHAGAALAALIVMVTLGQGSSPILAASAFAGALAMALAVYALAWKDGASPLRIILVGIGLSAMCGAAASFISVFGDVAAVQQAQSWLAGTFYLANWEKLWLVAAVLTPALLACLVFRRELDLISLGEDIAQALGQNVQSATTLLLLICVLLSAATVAVAGLIGFVGLIAPHIARALVGERHQRLIAVTALVGAALTLAADLVGRTLFAPIQLPAGLVTALVGGPAFIWLYRRSQA